VSDFVSANLGPQFVVTSATDLAACYDDSNATTPLVFVLSQGSDPTSALLQFAGASSNFLHAFVCAHQAGGVSLHIETLAGASPGVFFLPPLCWTPLLLHLGTNRSCERNWTMLDFETNHCCLCVSPLPCIFFLLCS
jgi:hypothetical protein